MEEVVGAGHGSVLSKTPVTAGCVLAVSACGGRSNLPVMLQGVLMQQSLWESWRSSGVNYNVSLGKLLNVCRLHFLHFSISERKVLG